MKRMGLLACIGVCILLSIGGCDRAPVRSAPEGDARAALLEARKKLKTKLIDRHGKREPPDVPPREGWKLVKYPAAAGELSAYLTVPPSESTPGPAIIWITGGDCNSIGDVWSPLDPEDDQSARAFREAGIVTMYPSLRGGNDGPGTREGFLGEVDDVLAAAEFLARQPGVDPKRIYLGGHSTGGTLVLLAAECTDRFRAVFSFGPVAEVIGYPEDFLPFDKNDKQERYVRSPAYWLRAIKRPTFVFEGDDPESGNMEHLRIMMKQPHSPSVQFIPVENADHFNILLPVSRLVAAKILKDTGELPNLGFSKSELNNAMNKKP